MDTGFAGSEFADEGVVTVIDEETTVSGEETTAELQPGWSLFSLPAPATEDTLSALADADVDTVQRWDAATQTFDLVTVEEMGFVEAGRRPRYYEDHCDAVLMNRDSDLHSP